MPQRRGRWLAGDPKERCFIFIFFFEDFYRAEKPKPSRSRGTPPAGSATEGLCRGMLSVSGADTGRSAEKKTGRSQDEVGSNPGSAHERFLIPKKGSLPCRVLFPSGLYQQQFSADVSCTEMRDKLFLNRVASAQAGSVKERCKESTVPDSKRAGPHLPGDKP